MISRFSNSFYSAYAIHAKFWNREFQIAIKFSVMTQSQRDIKKESGKKNKDFSEMFSAETGRELRKGVDAAWRTQSISRLLIIKAYAMLGSASEPSFISIIVLQNQTKPSKKHTQNVATDN